MSRSQVRHPALHAEGGGYGDADTGDGGDADAGWQVKASDGVWQTENGGPTMMSRSQVRHPALHAEGGGHGDADTGDGGYADTGWQVKASDGVRQAEGGGGY